MKKIYLFSAFTFMMMNVFAQIEGTWRLAPNAGALAVGPNQGDGSWYSSSMSDVVTRSCLFDDSITFDASGAMTHFMDGSTWVETWQDLIPAGCRTPVAPHDGSTNAPFTYSYNSGTGELTVNGIGAHLGLAKVTNTEELASPSAAPSSITYLVSFSTNTDTMNVDINFGPGWWHYTYVKTSIWVMSNPNVTFKVNMSNYTSPISSGVYVNGSFNGWCGNCNPMTDLGNGIWQTTLPIPAGNIEYKFTVDGWDDQEMFTGTESCIDPIADGNNNRYLQFTSDITLPSVCFGSCDPCLTVSPELVGTWKLKSNAGSLGVGPDQGNVTWWSNTLADVSTRSCIFDDSIKFEANGSMTHYMDGSTWLEEWQGASVNGNCGVPVAPHDGTTNSPYTYSYNNATGELTTIGVGAHIGLSKVNNTGELSNPANAPSSITYQIALSNSNNTLTADINFGTGWWRFIYEKTQIVQLPDPIVTFRVDMADYTATIGTGVFLNGNFNGWCGTCNPMTNTSGSVWEVAVPLSSGPIEYKFTVDGWNDQENFVGGESCVDTNNDEFFNRYYVVSADATLPVVCFASCSACPGSGIEETELGVVVMPNPAKDIVKISAKSTISSIEINSMAGQLISKQLVQSTNAEINVSNLKSGTYFIKVNAENNSGIYKLIIE